MQSITSTLGAGSGLDIAQLTTSLVEAQFASKLGRLTRRQEELDARISAAATLKNQFTSLSSALGARVRGGELTGRPMTSDPASITATAVAGARLTALNADVEVVRLARAQTLSSPAFVSGEAVPGAGTLTIQLGRLDGSGADERATITVDVFAGQSLASVAEAINQASGGAVTASLLRSSDGTRLVLKGATGAANGFTVTAEPADATSGLAALSYGGGAGGSGTMVLGQSAQDSQARIDGVLVERATNQLADAIPGVTLDLLTSTAGRTVHLSLSRPDAALGTALADFVSALNEVRGTLATAADPKTGELRLDGAARSARMALTRFTSTDLMPTAAVGAPRTLAELGVKTVRDGTLSFDQAQFDRVLARDPAAVEALFTPGLYGLAPALDRMARSVTSTATPGSLAASIDRYAQLKVGLTIERTKLDDASARLRDQMTRQFAAMDSRVAGFRSTQSFLENQIKAWNADR